MYGPAPNIFHSGENRKPPFVGASGGGGGGEANTLQWQERWTAGEVEGGTSDSVTIGGHTLIIHDVGEGETVEAKAFMRPVNTDNTFIFYTLYDDEYMLDIDRRIDGGYSYVRSGSGFFERR